LKAWIQCVRLQPDSRKDATATDGFAHDPGRILQGVRPPQGVAQTSSLLYRGFPIRNCDQAGRACRLEVGDTVPIRNREKPALRNLGRRSLPPAWPQRMVPAVVLGALVAATSLQTEAAAAAPEPLYGFSTSGSEAQRKLEATFRSLPQPDNLRQYMQRLSAHPHHVGSPYDKENAEWILARFKEWGFEASIESFDVLFPTPKTRVLEMLEPVRFTAALQEPNLGVDPTSGQAAEQLPTYNAYSADGDVTGPLVYVNYGLPEDYRELERLGVSVKGAVVIARYGKSWRGIKPKVAAEHGAIGCLIYSDPKEDGYWVDEVFPDGPMRNSTGVQRGSVMDFPSTSPGDPLTPGYGAVPGAKRLPVKEAPGITRIPTLPLSSGDAQPLLAQLKGPVAPGAWRGALPCTYHVGPGPARVHLKLQFNWDLKPLYNVIGKLAGSGSGDEWVLRGNHHDGWVNGADDPVSGQVCLLEEARALGQLVQQGWRPRRTVIYCAWDGEEPGLIGSTEWVETHADELRSHAVAYINSDSNGRGYLGVSGSHILEHLANAVAREIEDPETKATVWKRSYALKTARAANADERRELRARADLPLDAPGSGSDYTAFIDFLGVPILDLGFEGEGGSGIYHSIYDDFYWYTHFSDTDFVYGRALAQVNGTTVLRLADAEVIPFEFTGLAEAVRKYTEELRSLLRHKQEEIEERNRQLEEDVFRLTSDPRHPVAPPEAEAVPPELNFAPLQNAAKALAASAKGYQKAVAKAQPNFGNPALASALQELNQVLLRAERRLTDPEGLPRRPWFKHLLYAPGVYSGYDAKTMPGVREGIELRRYDEAEKEIARVAKVLGGLTAQIDSASKILARFKP
ncbi:MAG TPA: M28 family metallopeptidase, partial [Dongiaceae bacterium]|nr:M28 family metallopeptidase [Dongiaceae bacterium]